MRVRPLIVQPRADISHYRAQERFEGRVYQLDWYTNAVDGGWWLGVVTPDGFRIPSVPVVARLDLLDPYRHLDVPAGIIFVEADRDPRIGDFIAGLANAYYGEPEAA